MIKNYILTAFRQLYKQKGYNLLNILGLSIGLVGFIFAMLYAEFMFSYDKFHEGHSRIFRVVSHQNMPGQEGTYAITPAPLSTSLVEAFPEIQYSACMEVFRSGVIEYEEKKIRENRVFYVEKDFFKVFPYKLLKGDVETALKNPNSIIFTKGVAEKYFGDENPIGKTLKFIDGSVVVTGIIDDPLPNSIMKFNVIAPIEILNSYQNSKTRWDNYNYTTFIRISSSANADTLAEKMYNYLETIFPDSDGYSKLKIQPIEDIRLYSGAAYDAFYDDKGVSIIYGLSMVSLFLLLLGCVNFVNLITARAEKRSKEISIRKTFGATKKLISFQFIAEAFLQSFIAFFLAMIAVELLHPLFNNVLNANIELKYTNLLTLLTLFAILLGTTILSGAYPAFFMASLKPIQLIRGSKGGKPRGFLTRRALIAFQMIITVVMIFSTLTISKQILFLKDKALGFDKENIIAKGMTDEIVKSYDAFRTELLQNPDIISVTSVMNMPEWQGPCSQFTGWEGNDSEKTISMYFGNVGYDYYKTLGLEIVKGRAFSKDIQADTINALIVNEKAVELMEMKDPIGKKIDLAGGTQWGYKGKIIGVVKDYHYNSPRFPIGAFMVKLAPEQTKELLIKHKDGKQESVEKYLTSLCEIYDNAPPIESRTMADVIENQYRIENIIYKLINIITIFTIALAALGLIGLIAYTTEKKVKEIGIRKVLGGTIKDISMLMFRQFLWILLIANVVAWPLAFYLNKGYLRNFERTISIDLWIFVASGAISLVFSVAILWFQTNKAAKQNPVISLKSE